MVRRIIQRRSTPSYGNLPDDLHPLLRRIYAGRNVRSPHELDHSLENLHPFESLTGIGQAAELLARTIESGKCALVVADYDADGATACAIAVRALRSMGAAGVEYLVPDRFRHGYGLSSEVVDLAAERRPDLLITVDNGISSIEGVARARSLGMDVIITDHHLPGPLLPEASAIVNPNLRGDEFPSKSLAGVGVMFYVLAALRARLRAGGWFARKGIVEPNLGSLLDLVALGTVADMVPMDRNNRILVSQGLQRIRAGRCSPSVTALLRVANRRAGDAAASDLGFFVGPRLNAAGRLTDMRLGIECLLSDDPAAAARMAGELDALNRERRQIQAQMQEQALTELPELGDVTNRDGLAAICIYNESWHAGVVGVLASQLKEQLQRPVIAFAREGNGLLKGSGRSVEGVHIRDAIANIANAHPQLVPRFGGHAMAAGLSLAENTLEEFSRLFEAEIARLGPAHGREAVLLSDGELAAGDFTPETAAMLKHAGPWGTGFPEPVFDGEFALTSARVVGERHVKLSLNRPGLSRPLDAIAFNRAASFNLPEQGRVHVAFRLGCNEYNGRTSVQLIVEEAEALA